MKFLWLSYKQMKVQFVGISRDFPFFYVFISYLIFRIALIWMCSLSFMYPSLLELEMSNGQGGDREVFLVPIPAPISFSIPVKILHTHTPNGKKIKCSPLPLPFFVIPSSFGSGLVGKMDIFNSGLTCPPWFVLEPHLTRTGMALIPFESTHVQDLDQDSKFEFDTCISNIELF